MTRNRILLGWGVAMGVLLVAWGVQGAGRSDVWWHDFQQAQAEARRTGRPMLLHFHASWCGPCREMEKDIFSDRDVQKYLSANFIPVKVDCSQQNPIANQFDIEMLPTELIVSPNGEVWMRSEGFGGMNKVSRRGYLDRLTNELAQHPMVPAAAPNEDKVVAEKPETPSKLDLKNEKPEVVAEKKLIIGLEGYSPVALMKNRQWKKGKPEYAWQYQGVAFLMSDSAESEEFQKEPAKFAPKLLGCDPVELWTKDKAIVGSTQFGAVFDESLYLFTSKDNRDRFKKEPNLFTKPQHVLKANDIDGPRWR